MELKSRPERWRRGRRGQRAEAGLWRPLEEVPEKGGTVGRGSAVYAHGGLAGPWGVQCRTRRGALSQLAGDPEVRTCAHGGEGQPSPIPAVGHPLQCSRGSGAPEGKWPGSPDAGRWPWAGRGWRGQDTASCLCLAFVTVLIIFTMNKARSYQFLPLKLTKMNESPGQARVWCGLGVADRSLGWGAAGGCQLCSGALRSGRSVSEGQNLNERKAGPHSVAGEDGHRHCIRTMLGGVK